jgi:hypothetical protein
MLIKTVEMWTDAARHRGFEPCCTTPNSPALKEQRHLLNQAHTTRLTDCTETLLLLMSLCSESVG